MVYTKIGSFEGSGDEDSVSTAYETLHLYIFSH